jgi:hypothetical protein
MLNCYWEIEFAQPVRHNSCFVPYVTSDPKYNAVFFTHFSLHHRTEKSESRAAQTWKYHTH